MSNEGSEPAPRPKQAHREESPSLYNLNTLTARLDSMTRERIDALEKDKQDKQLLQTEVIKLQSRLDELGPDHSRLQEALRHEKSNSTLATILIALGGFSVSYATFAGAAAERWVNAAAGCLLGGIVMLLWQSVHHRLERPR